MSEKLPSTCLSSAPKFVGAEKQRGRFTGRLCFSCSPTSLRQGEGARQIAGPAKSPMFADAMAATERHPSPASPALMDSSFARDCVVAGWRGEVGLKARRIWGRILASLRDFSRRAPLRSVGRGKCRGFFYRTCSIFHIVTCSIAFRFFGLFRHSETLISITLPVFRFPRMP